MVVVLFVWCCFMLDIENLVQMFSVRFVSEFLIIVSSFAEKIMTFDWDCHDYLPLVNMTMKSSCQKSNLALYSKIISNNRW